MRTGSCAAKSAIVSLILLAQGVAAEAAEIRVIASPGISTAFGDLGPLFERATGHTLAIKYGLVAAQNQQMDSGEFDLAVVPAFALDGAVKRGKIAADTRTPLARVGLGIGMRAGASKPDFTSVEAFKRALLSAKSVTYVTNEPTGIHIGKVYERLGIAEPMKAKTSSQDTVARVWQAVASGEAEFGFGFTSNVLSAQGVELAGSFPVEFQSFNVMAAGIGTAARQPDAAKAFLTFLRGSEAIAVMKAKGLEPAT